MNGDIQTEWWILWIIWIIYKRIFLYRHCTKYLGVKNSPQFSLRAKSGEGLSSPLQTLTYLGQTLLRYQAVDGILPDNYGFKILFTSITTSRTLSTPSRFKSPLSAPASYDASSYPSSFSSVISPDSSHISPFGEPARLHRPAPERVALLRCAPTRIT